MNIGSISVYPSSTLGFVTLLPTWRLQEFWGHVSTAVFSSGLLFVGFQGYFGICLNLETKIQTGFLSFLSAKDYPEDFFVFNLDQLWCLSPRPLSTIPQNGSMSDGPRDQGSKSRMSSKSTQCFRRTSQGAELVCLYGYVWIITDNIKEHS